MSHARWFSAVPIVMISAAGCTTSTAPAPSTALEKSPVVRGADGSLRVPFAGGAFATWNSEMPVEVIQAVRGETPNRPVMVWAGLEVEPRKTHVEAGF